MCVESLVCAGPYVPVQSPSTGVCYMCVGVPVREGTGGEVSCVQWVSYTLVVGSRIPVGIRVRGGAVLVWWGTCAHRPPGPCPRLGLGAALKVSPASPASPTRRQGQKHRPRVGLARFLAISRNFRVTPTSGRGSRVRLGALEPSAMGSWDVRGPEVGALSGLPGPGPVLGRRRRGASARVPDRRQRAGGGGIRRAKGLPRPRCCPGRQAAGAAGGAGAGA